MESLRPVAAAFVLFGVFWGSWAVAAADVERELSLSHGQFGLLLSIGLAGAATANGVGGALAERRGTGAVLASSLALWGGLLVAGAACPASIAFAVLLTSSVALGGLVDVVMNVAATAGLAGNPGGLVRFHALFNAGAAAGAAVTGLLLAGGGSWRGVWAAVGLAALGLAGWTATASLPAGRSGQRVRLAGAGALLRRERLVVVAVAFGVAAMVEGGIELWGVLFLRSVLPSGLGLAATSAVLGYSVAAAARLVLGPQVARRGPEQGVAIGSGLAACGIALLVLAPAGPVAGAGRVLAAGGISMCWPLLLATASANHERPGPVVGAVAGFGYLGFVVGPVVVGGVAGVLGLRAGLVVLGAGAVFVALAAADRSRRLG